MTFWEKLLGCPVEIHPGTDDFHWGTSGVGTRYLLITCDGGHPVASLYGTARESRSELLKELDVILREKKACLLLGIETLEISSKFFQLDPNEARDRLAV